MERRAIEATCPECRGPLTEIRDDGIVEYQCLVGHKYSPELLLQSHYETEERTLWAAVVGLEEAEQLVRAVAPHVTPEAASNLQLDAEQKREQANQLRKVLNELRPFRIWAE